MGVIEFGTGLRAALERQGVHLDVPRAAVPAADLLERATMPEAERGTEPSPSLRPRTSPA